MAENEQLDETNDEATAVLEGADEAVSMDLTVDIKDVGPCMKHVKVTIPRAEIEKVMDSEVQDLVAKAEVPGFRPGHVPEGLVRKRFKTELVDKVKQDLLMNSLQQLSADNKLEPINEPTLDVDGITIPDEGDFEYEFDVEVRPEFDLPDYKGLTIERPMWDITDADIEAHTDSYLEQYAQLKPVNEAAQLGDFVSVDVNFSHNGELVNKFDDLSLRVRPTLRFNDVEIEGFDTLMVGASEGDSRELDVTVSMEADRVTMRGAALKAKFTVLEVKRMEIPPMDDALKARLEVESEEELKEQVGKMLERQVTYAQRQSTRRQILEQITASADWELPEEMVLKQVENAMRRETLELQQAGFTTPQIRAREGELRQRSLTTTRQNLKEHFVLDRIANEEGIDVGVDEIETEMAIMAIQSGENLRRIRARMIKSGMIENLQAQIRERKAVDVIISNAKFVDTPFPAATKLSIEAVRRSVCAEQFRDDEEDDADENE